MSAEPTNVSRPFMPDYQILGATEGSGLLPWSWATEQLDASMAYWIATVGPDGRPAVSPTWGVLLDGEIWFSCGPTSRKARNLDARPAVTLATEDHHAPVVVEGDAVRVTDMPSIERFTEATEAKYHSGSTVEFFARNALYRVVPRRAIGLVEHDFTGSPTRWTFDA